MQVDFNKRRLMKRIYIIGGSPCSGKSTIASILSKKYKLHYFKVDENLEKYTLAGSKKSGSICEKRIYRKPDEIWLRKPEIQCAEEIGFYKEVFDLVLEDIREIKTDRDIIVEGAAFLPELICKIKNFDIKYMFLTPSAEFQVSHYKQRDWIKYVLENCSDKEKAFNNWMKRDILFANYVRKTCGEKYFSVVNDGSLGVEELIAKVENYFKL